MKAHEQGFDVVVQSEDSWGKVPNDSAKDDDNPKGIFSLSKAACDFMEDNRGRPFFVYLSHYAIHAALQSRNSSLEKFKSKEINEPHPSPLYLANTYDMDEGVGVVMNKLKELGLEENTLVVFTSDNGGTQAAVQDPLRGNKGSYYEGGIREPFIIRWPSVTKPGSHCDVPVISQDLFPTFVAAADVTVPSGKLLDGEGLLPLLRGEKTLKREAIFWHFPGYLSEPVLRGRARDVRGGFRSCPVSVIRKGDWKFHLFLEEWLLDGGYEKLSTNNAVELYNLKEDLGEYHDLSDANTDKRDELLGDLLAWHKSVAAPIPTEPNPKYAPGAKADTKGNKGKRKAATL